MPVFFITANQIVNGTVTITGPLFDHLRASLRVQPGEKIWTCDEQRRRYRIDVTGSDRRALHGRVIEQRPGPSPRAPRIVLGQAILKGERMDWAIQKATELGVHAIAPLVSEQTIVRPKQGRAAAQQERWQRIALEAAQQSERWEVPAVEPSVTVQEFIDRPDLATRKLILAERGSGQALTAVALPSSPTETIAAMIGPEGGWRAEEIAAALAKGFLPVTLGERILRAETAAVTALSVIQSRLGELG